MIQSINFTSGDCDLNEVNIELVFNPESYSVIPRVNLVVTPTLIVGNTPDRSVRVTFNLAQALGGSTFLTVAIDPTIGYGQQSFYKMMFTQDQFSQLGLRVKRGLENSKMLVYRAEGMDH